MCSKSELLLIEKNTINFRFEIMRDREWSKKKKGKKTTCHGVKERKV